MEFIFPDRQNENVRDIKYSLWTPKILQFASTLIIKHPRLDKYVVLKHRYPYEDIINLNKNSFYPLTFMQDEKWLIGKNVLIDPFLLGKRGRDAWNELEDEDVLAPKKLPSEWCDTIYSGNVTFSCPNPNLLSREMTREEFHLYMDFIYYK